MNFKAWLHSLVAAAISSFSTAVLTMVVDPSRFNFSLSGIEHVAEVGGLSALLSVLALLKNSPLPTPPDDPAPHLIIPLKEK